MTWHKLNAETPVGVIGGVTVTKDGMQMYKGRWLSRVLAPRPTLYSVIGFV